MRSGLAMASLAGLAIHPRDGETRIDVRTDVRTDVGVAVIFLRTGMSTPRAVNHAVGDADVDPSVDRRDDPVGEKRWLHSGLAAASLAGLAIHPRDEMRRENSRQPRRGCVGAELRQLD